MSRMEHYFKLGAVSIITSGVLFFSGCGGSDSGPISAQSSKYEAADDENQSSEPTAEGAVKESISDIGPSSPLANTPSPSPPESNVDPYAIPEGQIEELMAYIQGLEKRVKNGDVRGATQEEQFADYQNIQQAIIAASDKVLAEKQEEDTRLSAAQSKIMALQELARLNPAVALKQLRGFCTVLKDDKNPELSQMSRMMLLGMDADQLTSGERTDPKPILDALTKILADSKLEMPLLQLTAQAAQALQGKDFKEEAIAAFRMIGEAAQKSDDPQLATAAGELFLSASILELDVQNKVNELLEEKPNSAAPLVKALTTILDVKKLGRSELQLAIQIAEMFEHTKHYESVKQVYTLIETKYKGHEDEEVVSFAASRIKTGRLRASLPGQPFEVTGILPSGEQLDWSQYQGKIVLVDFWASWCGPCMAEMPNIEANYKLYRDKGFEVVGVNLDENPLDLQQFFANQKLPWPTVLTPEPKKPDAGEDANADSQEEASPNGFTHPLAIQCGVESIPFIVLVGRDGKVIDLHVRGEQLGERLAQLLGPSEEKKDTEKKNTEKPSEKPAEKESLKKETPPEKAPPENPAAEKAPAEKAPAEKAPEKKTPEAEKQSALLKADTLDRFSFVAFNAAIDDEDAQKTDERNPYEPAKDLSTLELVEFLLEMQDKPKSIQKRPGFSEAIVIASERLLAADDAKDRFQIIAAQAIFQTLHDKAVFADEKADRQLMQFVRKMKGDKREKIAQEVKFFLLERRAIEADKLAKEKIPELLTELKQFFASEKPSTRHLRIASSTIGAVNLIEDAEQREAYFLEFGKLFAKSDDRQLARYGKSLSKPSATPPSELVGKPIELAGFTALGAPLDWDSYRGKVVLVDFWASWCGPCRKEMPQLMAIHKTLSERGFETIGVNLDKDPAALTKFLDENELPWSNLVGEESQNLAEKYGVRGIPTMILVDRQGKIAAVAHRVADLSKQIETLLQAPATAKDKQNIAG